MIDMKGPYRFLGRRGPMTPYSWADLSFENQPPWTEAQAIAYSRAFERNYKEGASVTQEQECNHCLCKTANTHYGGTFGVRYGICCKCGHKGIKDHWSVKK